MIKIDPPKITSAMIELTNACNYKCIMCANRTMKRKKGFMQIENYKIILNKLKEAKVKNLFFWTVGETLLHKDAAKMINIAKKKGFPNLVITTNGSILKTKDDILNLMSSGINTIRLSFFGFDKHSYESVYKNGNFSQIVNTLKLIQNMRKDFNVNLKVSGVNTFGNKEYENKTMSFLNEIGLNNVPCYFVYPDNFAGKVHNKNINYHLPDSIPFCYQLNRVSVLYDGNVTACGCFDVDGQMVVGNLLKNSVLEIREGKKFQKILQCFQNGKIIRLPMCYNCNILRKTIK